MSVQQHLDLDEPITAVNFVETVRSILGSLLPQVGIKTPFVKEGCLNRKKHHGLLMKYFIKKGKLPHDENKSIPAHSLVVDSRALVEYLNEMEVGTQGADVVMFQLCCNEARQIYQINKQFKDNDLFDNSIIELIKQKEYVDLALEMQEYIDGLIEQIKTPGEILTRETDSALIAILCVEAAKFLNCDKDYMLAAEIITLTKKEFIGSPQLWLSLITGK